MYILLFPSHVSKKRAIHDHTIKLDESSSGQMYVVYEITRVLICGISCFSSRQHGSHTSVPLAYFYVSIFLYTEDVKVNDICVFMHLMYRSFKGSFNEIVGEWWVINI